MYVPIVMIITYTTYNFMVFAPRNIPVKPLKKFAMYLEYSKNMINS